MEALICKMCGVSLAHYDEWRDSMSDQYFDLLVERLMEKEISQVLIRTI